MTTATSEILNRPCVSEEMAKLAHQRYAQSDCRAVFLDGVRAAMPDVARVMFRIEQIALNAEILGSASDGSPEYERALRRHEKWMDDVRAMLDGRAEANHAR